MLTYVEGISFHFHIGCPNSPAKGVRKCEVHQQVACNFVDDDGDSVGIKDAETDCDLLVIKILNEKTTRQGQLFQVLLFFYANITIVDLTLLLYGIKSLSNILSFQKLFFSELSVNF